MFKLTGQDSKTQRIDETKKSYPNQPSNSDSLHPAANGDIPDSSSNVPANKSAEISQGDSMAQDIEEGRLSGYIGHGTTLSGETSFQKMLRVDGQLTGQITSADGTLIVGTSGQVDANIVVATAIINGKVNGDIIATKMLQLVKTAQVVGNIQAPRLVVEDGALIEGNCSMIKSKEDPRKAQNGSQPQPTAAAAAAAAENKPGAFESSIPVNSKSVS